MGKKPNILYIMSDSLSPHYMGCYGDDNCSTPNLDSLADKGVVFENAYCNSPLCAPSRASMLTGRYVSELGSFDNANEFSSDWPTMAHMFKRQGYETVIAGKMHIVGYDQYHGFDHRLALDADYTKGYNTGIYCIAYDWSQPPGVNPVGRAWMGTSYTHLDEWEDYRHHHDRDIRIHDEAVRYLSDKTNESKPFFCCVSYHHPHNPFFAPDEIKDRFRDKKLPLPEMSEDIKYGVMDFWLNKFHDVPELQERIMNRENLQWLYETYYSMVYDVDMHVGELLQVLEKNGIRDNTIIVFASDHGDMMGYRGMVQKRCFYDRAAKVPLIFSYPDEMNTGKRIKQPVSLIDLFPTFTDMAGGAAPSDLPGVSLLPGIRSDIEIPERPIFCEYHGEGVHAPCFMVRRGDFKYIYVHGHDEQLYDLSVDSEEYINIAYEPEYEGMVSELKKLVMDKFNPDDIAKKAIQSQQNRRYIFNSEKRKRKEEKDNNPF